MANTLNPRHRVAALLEARGEMNIKEIASAINLSYPALNNARATPEYKLLVEKFSRELTERTLDEAAQLLAKFNDEAPAAFATLARLNQSADRDSVRLGAAKELLDRSTVAPMKRDSASRGADSGGITIQLGTQRMGMIISALEDIGDTDTINLLADESGQYGQESSYVRNDISEETP